MNMLEADRACAVLKTAFRHKWWHCNLTDGWVWGGAKMQDDVTDKIKIRVYWASRWKRGWSNRCHGIIQASRVQPHFLSLLFLPPSPPSPPTPPPFSPTPPTPPPPTLPPPSPFVHSFHPLSLSSSSSSFSSSSSSSSSSSFSFFCLFLLLVLYLLLLIILILFLFFFFLLLLLLLLFLLLLHFICIYIDPRGMIRI